MALVGAMSSTRLRSGCSLHRLAFSMGTLEPGHESRLSGSCRSGGATAVEHGDSKQSSNDR
jgi:hypothetical protein